MSNLVVSHDGNAVTTSLAIAEGTDSQHKNVMELIRAYSSDLEEFGRVAFETRPFETAGGQQRRELCLLNEQQATLIITYMRNGDIVRAFKKRLVKAFFEFAQMARQPANPALPQNYVEALEHLIVQAKRNVELEHQTQEQQAKIAADAPKVQALHRLTDINGSLPPREASKALGIRPSELKEWLLQRRWTYVSAGRLYARQEAIERGVLMQKVHEIPDAGGNLRDVVQVHITPKGLARIAVLLGLKAA